MNPGTNILILRGNMTRFLLFKLLLLRCPQSESNLTCSMNLNLLAELNRSLSLLDDSSVFLVIVFPVRCDFPVQDSFEIHEEQTEKTCSSFCFRILRIRSPESCFLAITFASNCWNDVSICCLMNRRLSSKRHLYFISQLKINDLIQSSRYSSWSFGDWEP